MQKVTLIKIPRFTCYTIFIPFSLCIQPSPASEQEGGKKYCTSFSSWQRSPHPFKTHHTLYANDDTHQEYLII